ncbi:MAG: sulfate ABC transporter substrate-binding protein [Parasphingorhabdus sp.]
MKRSSKWRSLIVGTALTVSAFALASCSNDGSNAGKDDSGKTVELLNVSYDPTRELYVEINPKFAAFWKAETGQDVKINMSHGGAGKQARAVIDGLDGDVVTLALAYDIDEIAAKTEALSDGWQKKLPINSSPYTSTIVFLVRDGNPKGIKDWDDLIKPGVQVITPNPKTSGGARWNFLAAWAYAKEKYGSEAAAEDYVRKLFANVPVLDSGARGSTTTFSERGIGDVLLAWENEAFLAEKELGADKFDIIVPSISILAEPPVAVLDGNTKRRGTSEVAEAYLRYLYTPEAQDIIGKNFYRPTDAEAQAKYASTFPDANLVTIDGFFGGWQVAQKRFFNDGGVFDKIFTASKK